MYLNDISLEFFTYAASFSVFEVHSFRPIIFGCGLFDSFVFALHTTSFLLDKPLPRQNDCRLRPKPQIHLSQRDEAFNGDIGEMSNPVFIAISPIRGCNHKQKLTYTLHN